MATAKQAARGSQRGDDGPSFATFPFPGMAAFPFPGMDANPMSSYGQTMLDMQREWLVGMGQLQRDYLTFVGERVRKDIEIAKRMAECRDMQAALELQSAFVETARDDYMEETQKVLAKSREITEHCVECLAQVANKADGPQAGN
jgi:hypothetical protein